MRYNSKEEAEQGFRYAISKGYIPNGNYVAYECRDCLKWHYGHELNYNSGVIKKQKRRGLGRKASTLL